MCLTLGFEHPIAVSAKIPDPENKRERALLNRRVRNVESGGSLPKKLDGW